MELGRGSYPDQMVNIQEIDDSTNMEPTKSIQNYSVAIFAQTDSLNGWYYNNLFEMQRFTCPLCVSILKAIIVERASG